MTDKQLERDARIWAAYERMVEAAERGDWVKARYWAAVRDRLRKGLYAPSCASHNRSVG